MRTAPALMGLIAAVAIAIIATSGAAKGSAMPRRILLSVATATPSMVKTAR